MSKRKTLFYGFPKPLSHSGTNPLIHWAIRSLSCLIFTPEAAYVRPWKYLSVIGLETKVLGSKIDNKIIHKFHSEILSPWSFLTFWNGLPGIGRQLCIKMWFWHFFTDKIYVTVREKFSEPHFVALFFSNPGEKVWKARKTLSHSFPCFSNLIPGIGEKRSNKVWFWEFSTHRDIYFVCGKMAELHFDE